MNEELPESTVRVRSKLAGISGAETVPYAPGLYVVVGKNNSGKSRFLRSLAQGSVFVPADSSWLNQVPNSMRRRTFGELPPSPYNPGLLFPPKGAASGGIFDHNFEPTKEAFNDDIKSTLHLAAESFFQQPRNITLVPSNRHHWDESQIHSESYDALPEPRSWINFLFQMEKSPNTSSQQKYDRFRALFKDLSGGLEVTLRGEKSRLSPYLADGFGEHPIIDCGDGLRDLLTLVLYLVFVPHDDLLVEEPGTRLHPSLQRRVLQTLANESKSRQVWITTHDSLFVASDLSNRRYFVNRADGSSEVRLLTDKRESLRTAISELGWIPNDACLHDLLIYCEGPSDEIIFSAAARSLASREPRLIEVPVINLGGTSILQRKRREDLKRILRVAHESAPFANHVMIVDRDGRSEEEIGNLVQTFSELNFGIYVLEKPDLEHYYLDRRLLSVVFHELLTPPKKDIEISTEDIENLVNECLLIDESKPAGKQFEAIFENNSFQFSKTKCASLVADTIFADTFEGEESTPSTLQKIILAAINVISTGSLTA